MQTATLSLQTSVLAPSPHPTPNSSAIASSTSFRFGTCALQASRDQLGQLRDKLKGERLGKQGHSRSAIDNARALLHAAVHQQHHRRGPDWFSPSSKKKGQLADFLHQHGVQSIAVDDGRSIPASKLSADARGKAGGPTLVQLKTAVKQHLAAHPEINTTVPLQLMDDAGYELLYTPPYVSDVQPNGPLQKP